MKDLMTLIQHPTMQSGQKIMLLSGKPVILVRGEEKKGMGQPLANQQIMSLLKASLPQDVLGAFGWGKELEHELEVDGRVYPVRIVLKPDKSFRIEVDLEPPEAAAAAEESEEEGLPAEIELSAPLPSPIDEPPTAPVAPAPEPAASASPAPSPSAPTPTSGGDVSEELIEELITGDSIALIYYSDTNHLAQIEQAVGDFGFDPKRSNNPKAISEVLKYQDYPLFIMQLGKNFAQDPVFQDLAGMNMDRRRKQFSVLVAPGLKSNDAMLAYSLSVNHVVDSAEIHLLYEHIHAQMGSWKRFVGAFHEVLEAAGKL